MNQKPTALITGLEGFTGRYVADALSLAGFRIHGFVREGVPDAARSVVDLTDRTQIIDAVRAVGPEVVIHLAGISHVTHGNVSEIYQSNIVGTRNLLEALTLAPRKPRAVLVPSSAHVYGSSSGEVLHEECPLAPHNDYAVSKVGVEYMTRLWMDRLPIVLTRPFNYTGVGQSPTFLIPKIVAHARRGERTITLGALDVARDFFDVRDLAACYVRLMLKPPVGQVVNICSGVTTSLREIIDMVGQITQARLEVESDAALMREHEVKCLRGSNARLLGLVGPCSFRPLMQTLEWMVRAE